jgi:putative ABC transport system permease protein
MEWRRWIYAIPARLRAIVRVRSVERDLDDELAFHVAMQSRSNREDGMSDIEANRRARLAIGGVEQVKERSRDARPLRWAHDLIQDIRYGLRGLWKTPRFTVAAVLTVLLGVGANITLFNVLNPLLFKPLPYPEPDRIVNVFRTSPQSQRWPHSVANYLDHRDRNEVFEHLTAMTWRTASLADPAQPAERVFGIRATGNYFALFGVPPLIGRAFTAADDTTGAEPVVVLSYRFWQRRFAGDRGVVGRSIRLDGVNTTVIGVMPEDFDYPLFWGNVDIWRPFAFAADALTNRGNNFLREYGRLKPGVSPEQADVAMKAVAKRMMSERPFGDTGESVRIEPIRVASDVQRRISGFAFGLTFLVLLIACVNLASLQLARTAARAREFAIRGAIGGAKGRLMRQSLTESLLLSLVGGALAIPLSFWCTRLIATRQFADLPGVRITMDPLSLLFAFGCAMLTGVIFGAVPAWLAARADIGDVLKKSTKNAVSGRTPHRLRHALIVAEIAFALVTLAGSVSLIRGLQRITGIDPGWRADGLVAAQVNLIGPAYLTREARLDFFDALRARLDAVPGATVVALSTSSVPVGPFNSSSTFVIEGRSPSERILAFTEVVSPEYFTTLGITLRRGRLFTSDDRDGRTPVMIVNDTMARRLWPNEDPIGKRIGFNGPNPNWREVVGVVGDVTFPSFVSSTGPDTDLQTYTPIAQVGPASASILLRTSIAPELLAPDLRRVISSLDRDLSVYGVETARAAQERTTAGLRLLANVLGAFALLGLVLAAVGIFGVVSYSTAQRAGELGMRMALGAAQSEVLWLVLKQGISVTIVGAMAGLAGGLGLGRVLSSMLPRLPAPELAIVLGACTFMIAVALAAFYIPAWRASRISPMVALRHE